MKHLRREHDVYAFIVEWKRERISTNDNVVSGIMLFNKWKRLVNSNREDVLSERLRPLFDCGWNVTASGPDIENCRAIGKLSQNSVELCKRGASSAEHYVRALHVAHRTPHELGIDGGIVEYLDAAAARRSESRQRQRSSCA